LDQGANTLFGDILARFCESGHASNHNSVMKSAHLAIPLFAALFTFSLVGRAGDSPEQLQPLKYNHPGLVVDLGVGLWAWPMPVDYNRDGKIDLLVACPDKPSNGVWFFENTGEPTEKFPVFKPGVWVGAATHNLQVSYVRGEPRILAPGSEHENFRESKFATPRTIYPRANVHENPVRANMWRYVDYDGNGAHDLIVGVGDGSDFVWDHAYDAQGRWRNGPLHGYIYLIENRGTDEAPDYADTPVKLTTTMAASSMSTVGPRPTSRTSMGTATSTCSAASSWTALPISKTSARVRPRVTPSDAG
jgi:hypothetical protein